MGGMLTTYLRESSSKPKVASYQQLPQKLVKYKEWIGSKSNIRDSENLAISWFQSSNDCPRLFPNMRHDG